MLLGALASVLALVGPAYDPSVDLRIAPLPLEVDGELEPRARDRLREALDAAIGRAEAVAVDASDVAAGLGKRGVCSDEDCYRAVADATNAQFLLSTRIVAHNRVYDITLQLLAADGRVVATSQESCEICGVEEVAAILGGRVATLAGEAVRAQDMGDARISVTSTPAGARVSVDGDFVGRTPFVAEIEPGARLVRVDHPQHISLEREITAEPGVRSNLTFELQPVRSALKTGVKPWAWAGVGAGATSIAVGIALIAIDRNEYQRKCDADADGNCASLLNTKWAGAALLTTGSVLSTLGATFLLRSRPRDGEDKLSLEVGLIGAAVRGRF